MGISDRDYMRGRPTTTGRLLRPSRPGWLPRLRFALWLAWRQVVAVFHR